MITVMRKLLILALFTSPVAAEGPEFPLLAATYKVLTDFDGCKGLGETAFQIQTKQTIPVWFYPAELTDADPMAEDQICSIKTRRGADTVETAIPCVDANEAGVSRFARQEAFCKANAKLPHNSTLELKLTACLSPGRFELMEGAWKLGLETHFGPYALTYDFDDGMVGVNFLAAIEYARTDIISVVEIGTTSTPARLRVLIFPSGKITFEDLPGVELKVASEVDLYLFESDRASCLGDPGKCLQIQLPDYLDDVENPLLELLLPYSALGDLGAQPAPEAPLEMWNVVRCNED